jgi:ATP-dependent Clp protease, protease subunit
LEDSAIPKIGDVATIDGSQAVGEYVMPSGETYVFENGSLSEIKEATSDEANDLSIENEELKAQNTDLQAQNKKLEKDLKSAIGEIKNFKSEFEELKKNVSSSFNYNPEIEGKKPENNKHSRTLFKNN